MEALAPPVCEADADVVRQALAQHGRKHRGHRGRPPVVLREDA